jgi:curved DNA-binding protein
VLPEARPIDLRGDYYRLLGVLENASGPEIRRAYRRLARQHHPDLSDHNGAADRFSAVSEAYQVLRDPDQRARYDRYQLLTGAVDRQPDSAERPRDSGYPRDGAAFGAGRFARHPGWRRVVASGRDVEATLELSPQEAALAATTAVMLTDTRGNTIVLPAGTEPGQRICLPGAGGGGRTRGDLFLTVHLAAQDLHGATEIHNAYTSSRCSSQRR